MTQTVRHNRPYIPRTVCGYTVSLSNYLILLCLILLSVDIRCHSRTVCGHTVSLSNYLILLYAVVSVIHTKARVAARVANALPSDGWRKTRGDGRCMVGSVHHVVGTHGNTLAYCLNHPHIASTTLTLPQSISYCLINIYPHCASIILTLPQSFSYCLSHSCIASVTLAWPLPLSYCLSHPHISSVILILPLSFSHCLCHSHIASVTLTLPVPLSYCLLPYTILR